MGKLVCRQVEEQDAWPVCPHCEKEMREIQYFVQAGFFRAYTVRVFVCPHCRKVLGMGMNG